MGEVCPSGICQGRCPASVYRVLKLAGVLRNRAAAPLRKGSGRRLDRRADVQGTFLRLGSLSFA